MSGSKSSGARCCHLLLILIIFFGASKGGDPSSTPATSDLFNATISGVTAQWSETETDNETGISNMSMRDNSRPPASFTSTLLLTATSGAESSTPDLDVQDANVTATSLEVELNTTEMTQELNSTTAGWNGTAAIRQDTSTDVDYEMDSGTLNVSTTDLTSVKPPANGLEGNADSYDGALTTPLMQGLTTSVTRELTTSATREPTKSYISTEQPQDSENGTSITLGGQSTMGDVEGSGTESPSANSRESNEIQESNEIPTSFWFVLVLEGNCSLVSRKGTLEGDFKMEVVQAVTPWLRMSADDLTVGQSTCPSDDKIHLNLTVYRRAGGGNVSEKLDALEESTEPLLESRGQPFYVYEIVTADGLLGKEPSVPIDLRHSDVELLVYITVGSVCAFLLALAVVLLLCKYCDCRERKPFDFGDAPNLNMRLEDYTLTRIPRPKLGYVDYYRGLTRRYCPLDDKMTANSPNGMVQPFDTSVVPLEDARSAPTSTFRDCSDGVIVRPSDIHRFGESLSRICRAGRSAPSVDGYLTDADGYCVRSTENLHVWQKEDKHASVGVDNPNFQ